MTSIYCFIPARLKSTRLPNKMIKKIKGLPLIKYVYLKTIKANQINEFYVATCDKIIFDLINSIKGNAVYTSHMHKGCISRIAEAVSKIKKIKLNDFICIVQGDEVNINHYILNKFCKYARKNKKKYSVFNVVSKIKNNEEYKSKSVIKTLIDNHKNVLNFCRTNVIYNQDKFNKHLSKFILRQTGIIIIKKKLLIKYSKFSRTFFEKKESIDMLRFIENGIRINTFKINKTMIGIDTLQDYQNFIKKT